jgi:hypothetical protein
MINKLVEWLIEKNKEFGTNGFAVFPPFDKLCEKTNLITKTHLVYSKIEEDNLLIVGNYNIIDLNLIRPWDRFEFKADILPFGNMLPNGVEKIRCKLLGEPFVYNQQTEEEWVWNLTTQQEKYKGILTNPEDPAKHPFWWALTMDQKKIVAKYHQHIKATKIKAVFGKPIFQG